MRLNFYHSIIYGSAALSALQQNLVVQALKLGQLEAQTKDDQLLGDQDLILAQYEEEFLDQITETFAEIDKGKKMVGQSSTEGEFDESSPEQSSEDRNDDDNKNNSSDDKKEKVPDPTVPDPLEP